MDQQVSEKPGPADEAEEKDRRAQAAVSAAVPEAGGSGPLAERTPTAPVGGVRRGPGGSPAVVPMTR